MATTRNATPPTTHPAIVPALGVEEVVTTAVEDWVEEVDGADVLEAAVGSDSVDDAVLVKPAEPKTVVKRVVDCGA